MAKAATITADLSARTVTRTARGPRSRYVAVAPLETGGVQYELKPAAYKMIERQAREGHELASIASSLGMCAETFRQIRKRDPQAVAAIEVGRAELGDELTALLLTMARKGNVTAAIWLDKTRRNVDAGRPIEGARTVVNQQFNINLPAPRARDEYLRLVTGQAVDDR